MDTIWDEYDKDKNGTLSFEEVKAFILSVKDEMKDVELEGAPAEGFDSD